MQMRIFKAFCIHIVHMYKNMHDCCPYTLKIIFKTCPNNCQQSFLVLGWGRVSVAYSFLKKVYQETRGDGSGEGLCQHFLQSIDRGSDV